VMPSGFDNVKAKNTKAMKYITTNGAVMNSSFSILTNLTP
jgi:hypothetical protein